LTAHWVVSEPLVRIVQDGHLAQSTVPVCLPVATQVS
jgi:hypothetical protein